MNVTASCDMCDMLYDRFVTAVTIISFFLNQQFIMWGAMADYSNYKVAIIH